MFVVRLFVTFLVDKLNCDHSKQNFPVIIFIMLTIIIYNYMHPLSVYKKSLFVTIQIKVSAFWGTIDYDAAQGKS